MSAFGCVFSRAFPVAFGDTSTCGVAAITPVRHGGGPSDFYYEARPRKRMDTAKEEAEMLEFVRALMHIL